MARAFSSGSSQYLRYSSPLVAVAPFTLAGWIYPTSLTSDQALIAVCSSSGIDDFYNLRIDGTSGQAGFNARAGGDTTEEALSSSNATANAWNHICGIAAAVNDRTVYLDGGNSGSNTATVQPLSLGVTDIGSLQGSYNFLNGYAAEVGLWNVALSAAEVMSLAIGANPLTIRPQSLVSYWPLIRDEDQDLVGGYDLTPINSPTIATHPPGVFGRVGVFVPYKVSGAEVVQGISNLSGTGALTSVITVYISGQTVWGHITGVVGANIRTYSGNWAGTASIENSGDNERIAFSSGENSISEIVYAGSNLVQILQNVYQSGDTVTVEYRTAATVAGVEAAGWSSYTGPFTSSGFVQIRLTSTV